MLRLKTQVRTLSAENSLGDVFANFEDTVARLTRENETLRSRNLFLEARDLGLTDSTGGGGGGGGGGSSSIAANASASVSVGGSRIATAATAATGATLAGNLRSSLDDMRSLRDQREQRSEGQQTAAAAAAEGTVAAVGPGGGQIELDQIAPGGACD